MRTLISRLGARATIVMLVGGTLAACAARAGDEQRLTFQPHGVFFSQATEQPALIDPQVFVHADSVKAGTGPENIAHVAGVRPALVKRDPKSAPLLDADGRPLGIWLGAWLGASGSATLSDQHGQVRLTARFSGLRLGGRYSLSVAPFDQAADKPASVGEPGRIESFTAGLDGTAQIAVELPARLTHADAIVVTYHRSGRKYGREGNHLGRDAYQQLVARPE